MSSSSSNTPLSSPTTISHLPSTKQILAVFDFDGTLTTCDSLQLFLKFACGGTYPFLLKLLLGLPKLTLAAIRKPTRDALKETILSIFLHGKCYQELQNLADLFASAVLPTIERPQLISRLHHHLNAHHRVILLSASPELYLLPWARKHGIQEVLATRLKFNSNGVFIGHFDGPNCRGREKLRRLQTYLGSLQPYHLIAYADSHSDRFIMQHAQEKFYINSNNDSFH
ncbi:MAG: HAD-IB family hydrolase [Chthoniobacterales bacterium]|nr:HAD-IB family hydrolase [Chthoniobacterales bacterium]